MNDRIHDRWFDVEAITYDPVSRVVRIPFWNRPTSKSPVNRATGKPQPFDSLLAIHDADELTVEDKEHIGTYTFNVITYSNRQVVITADPNVRIGCSVSSLHIDFGPDAIDRLVAKLARYPEADLTRSGSSISIRPPADAGFSVQLLVDANGYTVFFDGGWHEQFHTEDEAINCVGFGLSSSCRLAVTYRLSSHSREAIGKPTALPGCLSFHSGDAHASCLSRTTWSHLPLKSRSRSNPYMPAPCCGMS